MPKYKKDYLRTLASLSSLGIEMAVSIIIGYLIGDYLDEYFDTGTNLTILFILFGIAAGFRTLIRVSRSVQKDMNEHKLDDVYREDKNGEDNS